jgi:type I restriction enzyme S subunit
VAVYGIRDGKQISYESLGMINIRLPPLPEQRAIAEVITTADRLIAVKQRIIVAKHKQKRWLMQDLLTGRIRTKETNV